MSRIRLDDLEWLLQRCLALVEGTVHYVGTVGFEPPELLQLNADLVSAIGEVKEEQKKEAADKNRPLLGRMAEGEGEGDN